LLAGWPSLVWRDGRGQAGVRRRHSKAPGDSRFWLSWPASPTSKTIFAPQKTSACGPAAEPADSYSREFLATIYFLEGNLEGRFQVWNLVDKPRLRSVAFKPALKLKESLRGRAVAFNAPQILTADALLQPKRAWDNLGIFSSRRVDLSPQTSGNYDATLHLAERNGWGRSKVEGIARS